MKIYGILFLFFANYLLGEETFDYIKTPLNLKENARSYNELEDPKDSNYYVEKKENYYYFSRNDRSYYKISFFGNFSEEELKELNFHRKIYEYSEIEKTLEIGPYYQKIKELYLNSKDPSETRGLIYKYLYGNINVKDNIDKLLNIFGITKMFFKNFEGEQLEFLEKLFVGKKEIKDRRGEMASLSILKDYNSFYDFLYGKRAIETGINEAEGVNTLLTLVEKKLDKEAAKILGEYYLKRDMQKSEQFLYLGDKLVLAKYYLENGLEEKYNRLYDRIDPVEKEEIDKFKDEFDKEKNISFYLTKAKLNVDEGRLDLGMEYYNKVMENSKSNEKIKEALFNLGKIYLTEEKYTESLEIFDTYIKKYDNIKEVEALYYLGLCNFELKKFEKSDIIFNQIKKMYPYTIWEEKIKIILKEI